jgi:diacylglycerol kinase (ATP)
MEIVIAVGGDGTCGNVARALLEAGGDARLGVVPAGSGNDFACALGLDPRRPHETLAVALGKRERRVDMGRVAGLAFLNVAGMGFDAAVLAALPRFPLLRGQTRYLAAAMGQLVACRARRVRLRAAGPAEQQVLALVFANGPRFGGGFRIAPRARPDDGLLDMVAVGDARLLGRLRILAAVLRGSHIGFAEISYSRIREAVVELDEAPWLDLDGELRRAPAAELTVSCLPAALRVAIPGS